MQVLLRSMLPLLRCHARNRVVTSPAQYTSSALPRDLSALRWLPPALARRDSPLTAPPNPPVRRRVLRFPNGSCKMSTTSVIKGDKLAKPDNGEGDGRRPAVHDGDKHMTKKVTHDILLCGDGPPEERSDDEEFEHLEAEQLGRYRNNYPNEDVYAMHISAYSTHRDGSIYRGICPDSWKKDYRIANRNETQIEAMMLSNPKDCMFCSGTCRMHSPINMLQIFSLKLAKITVDGGSIELYGYMAARDILDPLLNYVVNISRNDPIIVKQGSLIQMTGPKRGIELCDTTVIEYDMRIKTGRSEKDDLQLIDGVSFVDDRHTATAYAFTRRIHGDCGAVDITVSRLDFAVEATIEVYISEVRSGFNLRVGCLTSGLCEEIQLFKGAIGEPRALRRSVIAAVVDTWMDVKLNVGSGPSYSSDDSAEHCCTFRATNHGWTGQQLKVEFASILVKIKAGAVPTGLWELRFMAELLHGGFGWNWCSRSVFWSRSSPECLGRQEW